MNLFSNDLMSGVMNMMSNNTGWSGNEKENTLRNNLQRCTYPDETKWMIEKACKQLFHVYPFFTPDILMFTEHGQPRRYIELKGILEVDIKGKTCKVDFNMMLPNDYPRTAPFVRIVNRNPDYVVDPFYQSLKSKTDPSSYVLNEKLNSVKGWQPSSSLVNVVIECYDTFKSRFPFSKPIENSYSNNAWDALYVNKPSSNTSANTGGWGASNNQGSWGNNNNQGWGNSANTGWNANTNPNSNWSSNNPPSNNAWTGAQQNWGGNKGGWGGNTNTWNDNANTGWGNNTNTWGQQVGGMGGMGGIMGSSSSVTNIASSQKLVAKQKQTLNQINAQYLKVIEKVQLLDVSKHSLESEQTYLRKENFEMANFLQQNENAEISSIGSIVQPKDAASEQILDLLSVIKAREECTSLLEGKFNQEQLSLQEFLKHLRKIEEAKFEEKYLLHKCLKQAA